jgi:hypothetical protein
VQITVPIQEVREGDTFVANGVKYYVVVKGPQVWGNGVGITVQFPDGGTSVRTFDFDQTLTVERAS